MSCGQNKDYKHSSSHLEKCKPPQKRKQKKSKDV